jgi:hypothetical protein
MAAADVAVCWTLTVKGVRERPTGNNLTFLNHEPNNGRRELKNKTNVRPFSGERNLSWAHGP